MKYTDYDKFVEKIGILSEEQLIALGWTPDNGNRICYSRYNELIKFMNKLNSNSIDFIKDGGGKKYHIATDLDSCDLEASYCDEHGIDVETNTGMVVADSIVNCVAYVNRMDYYLCDGNADEELYLEFVEEV